MPEDNHIEVRRMNDSTMPPEERRNMNDSTMPPPPPRITANNNKKKPSVTSPPTKHNKSPTRVRSIGGGFGPPPPARARNKMGKAPLAKGFGLHDWALLTKQAKDLAQRKGAPFRQISLQELAQHDQVYDGWCALKGKVYNIGPYLPYHPGGERIMHKVLGKDSSKLFDKYHPWVNIDGYVCTNINSNNNNGKALSLSLVECDVFVFLLTMFVLIQRVPCLY